MEKTVRAYDKRRWFVGLLIAANDRDMGVGLRWLYLKGGKWNGTLMDADIFASHDEAETAATNAMFSDPNKISGEVRIMHPRWTPNRP